MTKTGIKDLKYADLSKKEVKFILAACNMPEGVFDFENNTNKEFREKYGMQKDEIDGIIINIRTKMNFLINMFNNPKIK